MAHRHRTIASRRRFLKSMLAGTGGFALSSCGWTLAKVQTQPVAQQRNSDTLHIYTWANYIDQELVEAFQAKTGIKVVFDIFDSNETMMAIVQAGKGSTYSIIYPSDYKVQQMTGLGLLSELDHSRLDGLNHLFDRFHNAVHDPGNRYSIPITWGTTGLVYDSAKLQEAPTDWDYLWQNKDKLTRRVTMMDDVREVMGASLRSLGFSYNSKNPDELKKAYDRLRDLKGTIATFTTDAWRDRIIAGDLLIAMCYSSDAMNVMEQNKRLKFAIPKSGTSLWSDTMVIPKSAPNQDAAYAWLNFMLQPEIAATVSERLLFATPNQAAFRRLPPSLQANATLFPSESQLKQSESIAPIDKPILDLYDQYWTQLTSS